jgi:hypothetical protein
MALSAIVVSYQRRDLLAACLASLERALDAFEADAEVIVVDNASTGGVRELVEERFPAVRLVAMPRNVGFAAAVNAGFEEARGDWILVLNNDTELAADSLTELVRTGESADDVGAVSPQIRFAGPASAINSAGIEIDALGVASDRLLGLPPSASEDGPVEVFGASGGAALYRRSMLEDVGGMDESFFSTSRTWTWRGGRGCAAGDRSTRHRRWSITTTRPRRATARGSSTSTRAATASGCWPRTPRGPSSCEGCRRSWPMTWHTWPSRRPLTGPSHRSWGACPDCASGAATAGRARPAGWRSSSSAPAACAAP